MLHRKNKLSPKKSSDIERKLQPKPKRIIGTSNLPKKKPIYSFDVEE